MTVTRAHGGLLVLLTFASAMAVAADPAPTAPRQSRIRTTEPRLRSLLEEGVRTSPTFRALVTRLERSDVVVYLQYELCDSPPLDVAGRLTFVSTASGIRYVMVRVRSLPSPVHQLAIVGHELQHAVEIAERPAIVDERSMLREYSRIGQAKGSTPSGVAFDTRAAVDAGAQVQRELRTVPGFGGREPTIARMADASAE